MTCFLGIHARVFEGTGGMGDAYLCADCGHEKYPEVFGAALRVKPMNDEAWAAYNAKDLTALSEAWPKEERHMIPLGRAEDFLSPTILSLGVVGLIILGAWIF